MKSISTSLLSFFVPACRLLLCAAALGMVSPAFAAGPGKQNDFGGRRVLFIGIDGCRRDVMRQVVGDGSAPTFAKIESSGRAFWNVEAGGEPDGPRRQPTISGPGWSTLLTGVFADKHLVVGNGEKFMAGDFQHYPHFFRHIRDAKPNAWLGSIVGGTWPEVNNYLIRKSGPGIANDVTIAPPVKVQEGTAERSLTDGNVANEAKRCLETENPDVLFLHFLDVDHAGHQFGFSPDVPQYIGTLRTLDGLVGQLMDGLQKRPQYKDESWLIVVSTDHGGLHKNHGGQTPDERQIFAFFDGAGFKPRREQTGAVYQTIVTPTILSYLGIPIDPAWGLESEPLKPDPQ